jgi:hypothetical protein
MQNRMNRKSTVWQDEYLIFLLVAMVVLTVSAGWLALFFLSRVPFNLTTLIFWGLAVASPLIAGVFCIFILAKFPGLSPVRLTASLLVLGVFLVLTGLSVLALDQSGPKTFVYLAGWVECLILTIAGFLTICAGRSVDRGKGTNTDRTIVGNRF